MRSLKKRNGITVSRRCVESWNIPAAAFISGAIVNPVPGTKRIGDFRK